jgi:MFS family permease
VTEASLLLAVSAVATGFVACGLAPTFAAAVPAFALAGVGNGLVLVYERLLIQTTVPDRLMARVFGVKDGLTAWAFAVAFVAAGGLVEAFGARALIVAAGVGGLVVWAAARIALRRTWVGPAATEADGQGYPTGTRFLPGEAGALGVLESERHARIEFQRRLQLNATKIQKISLSRRSFLAEEEKREGFFLSCQARPLSDLTIQLTEANRYRKVAPFLSQPPILRSLGRETHERTPRG